MRVRYRYPRRVRIRRRRDFLAIQHAGKTIHTRYFLVLVACGGAGRVGITVSKKIGNAVTRNRVKRLVREFVRQAGWQGQAWVPRDRDLIIVAKRTVVGCSLAQVRDDLVGCREKVAAC